MQTAAGEYKSAVVVLYIMLHVLSYGVIRVRSMKHFFFSRERRLVLRSTFLSLVVVFIHACDVRRIWAAELKCSLEIFVKLNLL